MIFEPSEFVQSVLGPDLYPDWLPHCVHLHSLVGSCHHADGGKARL